jgi:diamine N-acetyltransferase
MEVALRSVTRGNVRALCDLRLRPDQHELVAPAAVTIAEAHYEPGGLLRAIYADDEPVGILFVETEGLVPYLVRFMITEERQRSGIGRPAVELLARELREAGSTELEVSFAPVEGGAEGFWRRCGFTDTGRETFFGERIFKRQLQGRP